MEMYSRLCDQGLPTTANFTPGLPGVFYLWSPLVSGTLSKNTPEAGAMSDTTLPADIPEPLTNPQMNFNLALDVALGVDEQSILDAYNLQSHQLEQVKATAVFQQNLKKVNEELAERGASFRLKAQAQAEVLLAESFRLAMSPEVSANVRADMITKNVRWAGFDQPAQGQGNQGEGGFSIAIHLHGNADQPNEKVINHNDS